MEARIHCGILLYVKESYCGLVQGTRILPWKVGINSVLLLDSYKTHDPLEANLGREPVLFLSQSRPSRQGIRPFKVPTEMSERS